MPVKEAILDGEVVAFDTEGRQNFRDLIAGRGNLHYAAFDALWITRSMLCGSMEKTCEGCRAPGGSAP